MILAVPVLTEAPSALALEVQGGGVEEHHVQGSAAVGEQVLLDEVLDAPRGERCAPGLRLRRQRLPQPGHGPVQVVELERFGSRQPVPAEVPVVGAVRDLQGLHLAPVADPADSALWNGLIDRYHYLGYRPLPGAQLRYLIRWDGGVVGAMGFGPRPGRWACATAGLAGMRQAVRSTWGRC